MAFATSKSSTISGSINPWHCRISFNSPTVSALLKSYVLSCSLISYSIFAISSFVFCSSNRFFSSSFSLSFSAFSLSASLLRSFIACYRLSLVSASLLSGKFLILRPANSFATWLFPFDSSSNSYCISAISLLSLSLNP